MTQAVDQAASGTAVATTDLVAAIQRVLQESEEPLTVSKIKSQIPAALRSANLEETLQQQVAANVVIEYPKYRSPHARYWDRPMPQHIAWLLRETLRDGALPWSELRRKLPAYAVEHGAETILQEQVTQSKLFRHPKLGGRGGDRFGVAKPDAKDYLRPELVTLFAKLGPLGFTPNQLRESALELLHEEEWATVPAPDQTPSPSQTASPTQAEPEGQAGLTDGQPS
jgi:hypothetical protein